jgi:lipoprotein-anchoring transpeptidase ErfK/SrfK
MQHGNSARGRHGGSFAKPLAGARSRRIAAGVAGLTVVGLLLAACGSGSSASGGGAVPATTTPSAPPVAIAISPAATAAFNPSTPVVVKATNGTLKTVTVTNTATGVVVTGDYSTDKTTWTSNENLGFGASYAVDAAGANAQGSPSEQKATLTTISPSLKTPTNMFPAPSSVKTTGIGVGMPIIFEFDHSITNKTAVQQGITITSSPSQPGAFYWISSTELDYRPESYWEAGTDIHVVADLYGVEVGDGLYDSESRDETYHVHDALVAKADGNTEKMNIYDNGSLIKTMDISMGKDSTPTSLGTHVITAKNQSVEMNSCTYGVCPPNPAAYDETEYWAERITNGGEFVHENPDTVGSQGHSNVSHGCINLDEADAEWFFNNLGVGDVVEVTNSGGPQIATDAFIGDWSVPWSTWEAGNA